MPTVNKVVKEFITFGDFVDENGPKLTKNAFEKLSLKERDEFRKAVSLNFKILGCSDPRKISTSIQVLSDK